MEKSYLEQKYSSALESIISENRLRPWMSKPFHTGDRTASTNGYVCVSVPKFGDYEDQSEKVSATITFIKNMVSVISISDIKTLIEQIPLVPGEVICECCNGNTEVEYEFYHGRKRYTEDLPCPVCDGSGYIRTNTGEKMIDFSKQVRIGNSTFNVVRILELIKIAEILEEDSITLVRQIADNAFSVFEIGDADVIVMPAAEVNRNKTYVLNI
jgi:hypothetical protein